MQTAPASGAVCILGSKFFRTRARFPIKKPLLYLDSSITTEKPNAIALNP